MRTCHSIIVFLLILLILLVQQSNAVEKAPAENGYVPDHLGVSVVGGTKGNATAAGIDVNASYLLTNIGFSARSWSVPTGTGSAKNDLGLYVGIGLGNLLQLQAGHSSEMGVLLRLRSDYPLALNAEGWDRFYQREYWMITPFIEIPLTAHHGTLFGLGVGRTF